MSDGNRSAEVFLARVTDFLSGQGYPATKAEVVACARRANTASDVYAALLDLPERRYETAVDLEREIATRLGGTRT